MSNIFCWLIQNTHFHPQSHLWQQELCYICQRCVSGKPFSTPTPSVSLSLPLRKCFLLDHLNPSKQQVMHTCFRQWVPRCVEDVMYVQMNPSWMDKVIILTPLWWETLVFQFKKNPKKRWSSKNYKYPDLFRQESFWFKLALLFFCVQMNSSKHFSLPHHWWHQDFPANWSVEKKVVLDSGISKVEHFNNPEPDLKQQSRIWPRKIQRRWTWTLTAVQSRYFLNYGRKKRCRNNIHIKIS